MPPRKDRLGLPFSGAALTQIRVQAGLNRTELAKRLVEHGYHVHRTSLGRIESGQNMPEAALLKALTEVLGVSQDDLMRPTDERSRAVQV